jgi:glutamate formiminotransferase
MNSINSVTDVYSHFFETIQKNNLEGMKAKIKAEKICPDCGDNELRRISPRESNCFRVYTIDQLEYGKYECICGRIIKTEPESDHFGEPKGIVII